jgi:hypothetical protein
MGKAWLDIPDDDGKLKISRAGKVLSAKILHTDGLENMVRASKPSAKR